MMTALMSRMPDGPVVLYVSPAMTMAEVEPVIINPSEVGLLTRYSRGKLTPFGTDISYTLGLGELIDQAVARQSDAQLVGMPASIEEILGYVAKFHGVLRGIHVSNCCDYIYESKDARIGSNERQKAYHDALKALEAKFPGKNPHDVEGWPSVFKLQQKYFSHAVRSARTVEHYLADIGWPLSEGSAIIPLVVKRLDEETTTIYTFHRINGGLYTRKDDGQEIRIVRLADNPHVDILKLPFPN